MIIYYIQYSLHCLFHLIIYLGHLSFHISNIELPLSFKLLPGIPLQKCKTTNLANPLMKDVRFFSTFCYYKQCCNKHSSIHIICTCAPRIQNHRICALLYGYIWPIYSPLSLHSIDFLKLTVKISSLKHTHTHTKSSLRYIILTF